MCDQFVQVHFLALWLSGQPLLNPHTHTHTHTLSIYLSLRDCISYTGTQCSEVLHADWKVFLSNTSINLEDHLSQVIQLSGQFSEKCRVFVKSALSCPTVTLSLWTRAAIPPSPCARRAVCNWRRGVGGRLGSLVPSLPSFSRRGAIKMSMLEVLATNQGAFLLIPITL